MALRRMFRICCISCSRPIRKCELRPSMPLYGNIFHQGTRYPATPHVIPFLIELCAESAVPDRSWLLSYWGSLITGYFSVQERPVWGDGERLYFNGEVQPAESDPAEDDPYSRALHQIYLQSLKGYPLLCTLIDDPDFQVRTGVAWVMACLPTKAAESVPLLDGRKDQSGWVRAATAFALGELGAASPLRRMLAEDNFPAVRCMAACELARLDPDPTLIEPLLDFVANNIEGYEGIPAQAASLRVMPPIPSPSCLLRSSNGRSRRCATGSTWLVYSTRCRWSGRSSRRLSRRARSRCRG